MLFGISRQLVLVGIAFLLGFGAVRVLPYAGLDPRYPTNAPLGRIKAGPDLPEDIGAELVKRGMALSAPVSLVAVIGDWSRPVRDSN